MRKFVVLLAILVHTTLSAPGVIAAESHQAIKPAEIDRRVALVIGNGDYRTLPKLINPEGDAKAIAAMLRRLGFTEVMLATNFTRAEMAAALEKFKGLAKNAAWAVVSYAGHGMEVDGRMFLMPVDAAIAKDNASVEGTVSLDDARAAAAGATVLGIVIVDASRDNRFTRVPAPGPGRREVRRGLASISEADRTLVFYSSRSGQPAADGIPGAGSPFAAALLRHIDEPGLDVALMFRQVRNSVMAATANQQSPYFDGLLSGEVLSFRPVLRQSQPHR